MKKMLKKVSENFSPFLEPIRDPEIGSSWWANIWVLSYLVRSVVRILNPKLYGPVRDT